MLKLDKVKQLLASAIQKIKIGFDVCGIKVEAIGRDQFEERALAITFLEHDESMVTAKIAATIATDYLNIINQQEPIKLRNCLPSKQ